MPKCSCCGVFTACSILVFSIVGIVMLALLMKSEGKEKVVIDSFADNFSSRGILEIARVNTQACPSGSYPLFNNIFPGTKETCLCKNNSTGMFTFEEVYKNRCRVNQYYYQCNRMSLPEKNLGIYRGARICYRPSQFSYDSYKYSSSKSSCPSGTRVCGKDAKGYLCLPSTYPCPVNFLKMVRGNVQSFSGVIPGEKIISLDQNNHLIYSNQNVEGEIVAETNWTFQGMCADPNQKLIQDDDGLSLFNGHEHWVEQCDDIEGIDMDKRWRLLDTYNWLYLLGENASTFKKLQSSNSLDVSDLNIPYQVYHRGYLHFNQSCKWNKSASTSGNLRDLSRHSQDHPVSISGMMIGAIVMFVLAILVSICFFCMSLDVSGESGPYICCGCLWVLFLVAGCLIGAVFFYTRESLTINNGISSFNENCMDSLSAKQMSMVSSNKNQMFTYTLIALVLTVLGLLMLCCAGCCLKRDARGKKAQTSNNKYELSQNHGGSRNYHGGSGYHSGGKGGKIKHGSYSSISSDDGGNVNHYGGNYYDNPALQGGEFFNGQTQDQQNILPNDNNLFDGGRPNNNGFNNGGFNNPGFNNNNGFNNNDGGFNNPGFNNNNDGFNNGGFNNPGFNDGGFNNPGFNNGGFNNPGFNDGGGNNNPPPPNDYDLFGNNGGNDGPGFNNEPPAFNDFSNGNDGGFFDGGNQR